MNDHTGDIKDTLGDVQIVDCEQCGYVHKAPLPKPDEWKEYYLKLFYSQEDKFTYLEDTEADAEYRELLHQDKYENLIRLNPASRARSLLDIGSSGGNFIAYFQAQGWDVLGVEPSNAAFEFAKAKSRPTEHSYIEEYLDKSDRQFDVVHMREVLDNILNPSEVLTSIRERHLNSDGILIVDTSNDYNDFQECVRQVLGTKPWWIEGDTLNFFTRQTLRRLFEEAGYDVIHEEATFPLEMFILMGDNYLGAADVGRKMHLKRVQFEVALTHAGMQAVKRRFYSALAQAGLGRNIIMYGRPRQ